MIIQSYNNNIINFHHQYSNDIEIIKISNALKNDAIISVWLPLSELIEDGSNEKYFYERIFQMQIINLIIMRTFKCSITIEQYVSLSTFKDNPLRQYLLQGTTNILNKITELLNVLIPNRAITILFAFKDNQSKALG